MTRVTEVSVSYREEPGDHDEIVAQLEAQGWVQRDLQDPENTHMEHPQLSGQRRLVEK